jgi:hypothetical protein
MEIKLFLDTIAALLGGFYTVSLFMGLYTMRKYGVIQGVNDYTRLTSAAVRVIVCLTWLVTT